MNGVGQFLEVSKWYEYNPKQESLKEPRAPVHKYLYIAHHSPLNHTQTKQPYVVQSDQSLIIFWYVLVNY